jgi:hypothetical protein
MLKPILKSSQLEQAIADYDYLGKQIKALEDKRKALKESLVISYFGDQPVYHDINGCVLATYDERSRELVKGASLKIEMPDVYAKYMYVSTWMELRTK